MQGEFKERRHAPRTNLKQVVRIRPVDPQFPPEYSTTFNISESGLYFATSAGHYIPGMNVYVTSDFQPGSPMNRSVAGSVVRVEELENGQFGIAIQILPGR
jgi:PilZ domain